MASGHHLPELLCLAGSVGDALRAGLSGGISGAVTYGIGSAFKTDALSQFSDYKPLVHGLLQGLSSKESGGNFAHGFFSGVFSSAFEGVEGKVENKYGFLASKAVAAIAGGTGAAIGGGKFANGAATGVFLSMIAEIPIVPSRSAIVGEAVNIAGKLWALPNTVIGLALGSAGHAGQCFNRALQ